MTEQMISGGCFLISRNFFRSAIWSKPPQYARLYLVLLGRAAYQGGQSIKGHILKRGELVTTYGELAGALSFTFNRALVVPSIKEIRIMLSWLQSEGMILTKPLIDGTSPNKGRPIELTRAYVGLLIYVVNYNTYQNPESYKGRDKGRPAFEQGQLNNNKEIKKENILSESDFSRFYEAYPKKEGRKKALDAWKKINSSDVTLNIILQALGNQKKHKETLKVSGAFTPEWPMPATWLNGRRWEDVIPATRQEGTGW